MAEQDQELLADKYQNFIEMGGLEIDVPHYIEKNLASKFELRDYQEEAISIFNHHLDGKMRKKPEHLLYHMATGSGKTLIMAANILELYKRGYNNFVFFVNRDTIVEKTKKNFVDKASPKYLFSETIELNSQEISVEEVDNFSTTSNADINIHFTTIQGLHYDLRNPQENSPTFEEFEDEKVVLLSDEAHHLNASTKDSSKEQTWEDTVEKILYQDEENILLEYSATPGLDNKDVAEKYQDKILYQYSLKQFREDRFSKEVNVHKVDLDPLDRAMQSVILSQYRRKVAEDNGIPLKPVLLMKSSKIAESEENMEKFVELIENLDADYLREMRKSARGVVKEAFNYFDEKDISLNNLVRELKEDFSEEKCISVNSKDDVKEKQVKVNNLEADNNEVRVVFAVKKLNEGWDVLNLYDIVLMYDKKAGKSGVKKTTTQEAQLIGRGARYNPFEDPSLEEGTQNRFKRKYDDDLDNPLRVLEEMYYHSPHNLEYVQNLKKELERTGIKSSEDEKEELSLEVKDSFKETDFWDTGKIFKNKQIVKKEKDIDDLRDVGVNRTYSYQLRTGYSSDSEIFSYEGSTEAQERQTKKFVITDFGENVVRTALQRLDFYSYRNLKMYFSGIDSVSDFIHSDHYLSEIEVEVTGRKSQVNDLSQEQKLNISIDVLGEVEKDVRNGAPTKQGTKQFEAREVSEIVKDKTRKIKVDESGEAERGVPMSESSNMELQMDLSSKQWYVYNENYGTSQEKYLIKFISDAMDSVQEDYEDVYLIRNESLFKIFRFSDGQGIEPDFVLLLREKESEDPTLFQLFVEPKGEHLMSNDEWKEEFLEEIEDEYSLYSLYSDDKVKLVGMPFYNEKMKNKFEDKLSEVLEIEELY